MSSILAATAPDIATFVVGAMLVVGGALGVIAMRKPVHAALCLVVTLFGIAILFVAQKANFLAVVQVIVYAGAIVVLFLFVIMLLGVDRSERAKREHLRVQRPFAFLFAAAMIGLVVAIARVSWDATGAPAHEGAQSDPGSDVQHLADSIFTQYLFPFEATSILLVIAVVGAVVLTRSREEEPPPIIEEVEELEDDSEAESPQEGLVSAEVAE